MLAALAGCYSCKDGQALGGCAHCAWLSRSLAGKRHLYAGCTVKEGSAWGEKGFAHPSFARSSRSALQLLRDKTLVMQERPARLLN